MLTPKYSSRSPRGRGAVMTRARSPARRASSARSRTSGTMRTNSSPASRPMTVAAPKPRRRAAIWTSTSSPASWPRVSLTSLNRSRSTITAPTGRPVTTERAERGLQLLLHAAPGAQARQGVVAGLVGQLALHHLAGRDVCVGREGATLLPGHGGDRHHERAQGAVRLGHVVVPLECGGPTAQDGLDAGDDCGSIIRGAGCPAHHRDVVGPDPDLLRADAAQADLRGPGRVHGDDHALPVEHRCHGT